jgi:hypothetical protein
MSSDRWTRSRWMTALAALAWLACGSHASAANVTECTALNLCYASMAISSP